MSLENDITAIKKLTEADLFKPADDASLTHRRDDEELKRKAREVARKAGTDKTDFCPHCGQDLRSSDYGVYEEGSESYWQSAGWDERRETWEWGDRETSGNTVSKGWFCGKCQNKLKKGIDFDIEGDL